MSGSFSSSTSVKGTVRRRWRLAVVGVSALTAFVLSGSPPAAAIPVGGGGGGGSPTCGTASSGSLTATPSTILIGQSVALSWSGLVSSLCTSIRITGPAGLNQAVSATGSMTLIPPAGTSMFNFRAVGPTDSVTMAATSVTSGPAVASTGSGTGANNGPNPLPITTGTVGSSRYYLTDPTRPGLTCGTLTSSDLYTNTTNVWGNGDSVDGETACVDAMFAAQTEATMVSQWLGRNGLDGQGGAWPIKLGLPASFPSQHDYFSDGTVLIGHLTAVGYGIPSWLTGLPLVAHEFGHGIDSSTPGGTSAPSTREFVADVFGAATNIFANEPAPYHSTDFLVGPNGFYNPACYDGSTDTLDPHIAATVGDHWFYLLAEGTNPTDGHPTATTCNNSTVTGGGTQQALTILYNAMQLKTPASTYQSYRVWTLTAAKNLTPGDCTAFSRTKAAWDAVNVPAQPGDPTCVIAVNREPFGVVDWDGDGRPDVLARNPSNGDLALYPGPGVRGPLTVAPLVIGGGWSGFTPFGLADYNGDGHPDIIARQDFAGAGALAGSLWMYPGAGGRGPLNQGARVQLGSGWDGFTPFGVTDWDADGHPDIVARQDRDYAGTPAGSLWKYPGSGGVLNQGARVQVDVGWANRTPFGIGDYNGDGHPDLVARMDATGVLALTPGNGVSVTGQTVIGTGWGGWAPVGLTDYDVDGHVDIIARQDFTDAAATAGTLVGFVGATAPRLFIAASVP